MHSELSLPWFPNVSADSSVSPANKKRQDFPMWRWSTQEPRPQIAAQGLAHTLVHTVTRPCFRAFSAFLPFPVVQAQQGLTLDTLALSPTCL